MKERKPSFVMYESALEIARQLPNEYGYKFLLSVCEYGFYGIEPDFSSCEPYSLAMSLGFTPLRAAIDTSKKRYENCVKNGSGGGAPEGNQNARKQPKDSQETTKKTTKKQPKNNQKNNLTYTDTDTVTDSISKAEQRISL